MNEEVPNDYKQKMIDNIYRDDKDRPCKEDLTIESSNVANLPPQKQKRAADQRFTVIVNKYMGIEK